MKKSILVALTAAMVLTMSSMTAFAASPTVGTVEATPASIEATTAVEPTASGEVYASVTTVSEGFKETAVSETTVNSAAVAAQNIILNNLEKLGNATLTNAATDSSKKVSAILRAVVDIKPTTATKNAAGNYEFTITSPYIGAGTVYVLHYVESAKTWELLVPKSVTNGAVVVESATCSPFALVEVNVASATAAAKSPKTGETTPVAMMVILLGTAGAVVCGKKAFA
ncbi:MAG: hypothetical protein K5773_03030 [Pseudobutyrivibrio sp.]|nr:hypothetical protein [Pseudobutyrivibrio sp.]